MAATVSCFKRLLAELASIFPNHPLLANFVLVDVAEGAPNCLSKDCTTSAFLFKIWTALKRSMSEF
jgi:hypothetical protein